MPDTMRFAVDPLPGGSAAVGEEVSFREEGGKLYALNEDGEPFGAVPGRFAALLLGDVRAGAVSAEVSSREGGRPVVSVAFGDAPALGGGDRAGADGGGGRPVGDERSAGNGSVVCPKCGSEMPAGTRFCTECGYGFGGTGQEVAAEPEKTVASEPQQPGPVEPVPSPMAGPAQPAPAGAEPQTAEQVPSASAEPERVPARAEPAQETEAVPQSPDAMEPAAGFNREPEPGQPTPIEAEPAQEASATPAEPEPAQGAWTGARHLGASQEAGGGRSATLADEAVAGAHASHAGAGDAGGPGPEPPEGGGPSPLDDRHRKKDSRTRNIVIAAAVAVVAVVAIVLAVIFWPCSHEWAEATCTEPATCTKCGETEGDALGHDWQDATCTEPETCSRCGETRGEALGHDVEDWTVDVEATCSEEGSRHGTCTVCGEEVTESIAKTDHTEGEWTVVEEATVLSDGTVVPGEKQLTCSVCGEVMDTQEVTIDVYDAGGYRVGTDIPAGEYKLTCDGDIDGYYCVYPDTTKEDIIDNMNFDQCTYITVSEGQYLEVKRATFVSIDDATPTTTLEGSGTYKVGFDLEPGEYLITNWTGETGYYCVWSSSDVESKDIVDNDLFEDSVYITVSEGQYLELSRSFAS